MSDPHFFNQLAKFGDRVALLSPEEGKRVTYAELDALIEQKAGELGAARRLVFIEAGNTIPAIVNYLAALRAGHPAHLMESFDTSKSKALIEAYRPNILLSGQSQSVYTDDPVALHANLGILLSTSGSTGSPKFVKLSHRNLQSNAEAIRDYLNITADDRAYNQLKPFYSYGLSIINSYLVCGASLVLTNRSMLEDEFWQGLAETEATSISGVPYSYEMLLRRGFDPVRYPKLRYATQAGGKLNADMVSHFVDLFSRAGKEFYVMYGQTEASPRMSYLPPGLASDYPNSIGIAIPGGTLSVLDDEGNTVEDIGEPGVLAYSGPNVMMGYALGRDDLAQDETPEVLLTGDIAQRITPDLFEIVGRASRFVKPFGVRIGLDEVHDFVRETCPICAVTGTDEEIVIAVQGEADKDTETSLIQQCRERYGLPPGVLRVTFFETIPLLSSGKVDYKTILNAGQEPETTGFLSAFRNRVMAALGFDSSHVETVLEAFRDILQDPSIEPSHSFEQLGGDSLSYVSLSLELEGLLGAGLPDHWTSLQVEELDAIREGAALRSQ